MLPSELAAVLIASIAVDNSPCVRPLCASTQNSPGCVSGRSDDKVSAEPSPNAEPPAPLPLAALAFFFASALTMHVHVHHTYRCERIN